MLDATITRKNLNYLIKSGLSLSVTKHINTQLIFYDIYINDPTIISDIEPNSWVLIYLKSY